MTDPDARLYNFNSALAIANHVHDGQADKAGEPYILHPIRVALRLNTPLLRVLGLLHDVLEDAEGLLRDTVRAEIHVYFGSGVVNLLEILSRREENYEKYIERLSLVPILCKVKLADLADNLDQTRWAETGWTPPAIQRRRYVWARWYLERASIDHEPKPPSVGQVCKTPPAQMIENMNKFEVKL